MPNVVRYLAVEKVVWLLYKTISTHYLRWAMSACWCSG